MSGLAIAASILAVASLLAWVGVAAVRGGFWLQSESLRGPIHDGPWPTVVAIVPARDEAALIGRTIPALRAQDYPGGFSVLVVDDGSSDFTGDVARSLGAGVVTASPTPPGHAGKVWALTEGLASASAASPRSATAEWYWFTDADIVHDPGVLRRLVSRALGDGRDLVSVMAELRVETGWERLLVPAFVFFFAMLYPFAKVGRPGRIAAAAGGCILVSRLALERAGGLASIADALIDDVALATAVKRSGGRLFLGFDAGVRSIRPYPRLGDLWQMVARSAYDELDYSLVRLTGALVGLALMFLGPLLALNLAVFGTHAPLALGCALGALLVEIVVYAPTIRRYRLGLGWALALTPAGLLYGAMTLSSAIAHHRGNGVAWKGRRPA